MNRRGFIGAITALAALTKVKPEPASPSYEKRRCVLLPDPSIMYPLGKPDSLVKRWSSLYTSEGSYNGLLKHKER
jgi:hypothetical protein